MMVPLLQVALMLEVVVVDTVDRLYSFLDGLRARPWTPGADPAADAALLPDLAGLSRRADVRDAVLVKVVSPSMSQAAFRTVACRSEAGPDRDRRTADAYEDRPDEAAAARGRGGTPGPPGNRSA